MGYDPKAVLVKKEIKTLANGDKTFLKLMKNAIEQENKQQYMRKKANNQSNDND